jgi:proteasome lid subunit RPN8/RPN11
MLAGKVASGRNVATVVEIYALVNEAASPVEFRSAENRCLFAAQRDMRQKELDVVAVYHSHPSSDPVPSKKDREQWYYDSSVQLIIGLSKAVPEVRGWWISGENCEEAEWDLIDASGESPGREGFKLLHLPDKPAGAEGGRGRPN